LSAADYPTLRLVTVRRPAQTECMNELNKADRFNLRRFINAQELVYAVVLGELEQGSKHTHWMWYVFPQADGLGSSSMARQFAIRSREETIAYHGHPVLGERLRECTSAVLQHKDRTAHRIFGSPDDMKFLSCMTLFELASHELLYARAIDQFYGGQRDSKTIAIWSTWSKPQHLL
jgi:uncharacterized protein (DUF1810 family)